MAVIAVVNYKGKVLIGKKKSDSSKFLAGKWHIPGETIEDGETDEEALIRCMREEVELEITVGRYLGSHTIPTSKKERRWYECFSETDQITPKGDLEDAQWVNRREAMEACGRRVADTWPKEVIDYFNT